MKPSCIKQSYSPYMEARVTSKAAQLRENAAEIARLFAQFALGASFLSAVADRFGLWGPNGGKHVSWGDFAHFVKYTGAVTSLFPSALTVSFAWAATVAETLFGILLISEASKYEWPPSSRVSPFVICHGYGHGSWHQDAI